jgi:hypothetical protein
MKIRFKLSSCLFPLILTAICSLAFGSMAMGQYYYVNTYIGTLQAGYKNAILKIDIPNKQIVDSVMFEEAGMFFNKTPYSFITYNKNKLLISMVINGLSGLNTNGGDRAVSHYFIIDKERLAFLGQDSLPGMMVTAIDSSKGDSLYLTALDEQAGWVISQFVYGSDSHKLALIRSQPFDTAHKKYPVVGKYVNPTKIFNIGNRSFYYNLWGGDGDIILFSADSLNQVTNQMEIGNEGREAVIIGCNALDSTIYDIVLKFKIMSFSPPDTSEDSVKDEIIRISANDFAIKDTIPLNPGAAYFANENGTAEFMNGYLYYYFTLTEGGDVFSPAYMLIFDTRTNETTWLRVGWR